MKLKLFQKQDLARAALHDGLILSWDTGLGKTWAMFLWALLKVGYKTTDHRPQTTDQSLGLLSRSPVVKPAAPVLIIAPGDLHQQIRDEAWMRFRIRVQTLDSQEAFNALCKRPGSAMPCVDETGRPIIPPDFYIVSYSQLTTNGVARLPDAADHENPRELLEWLCLKPGEHQPDVDVENLRRDWRKNGVAGTCFHDVCHWFAHRGLIYEDEYLLLHSDPAATNKQLEAARDCRIDALNHCHDQKWAATQSEKVNAAYETLHHFATSKSPPKFHELARLHQDYVIRMFCAAKLEQYSQGIGDIHEYPIGPIPEGYIKDKPETDTRIKRRIKGVYSPSLADLCYLAFDCVVIDEGVKMKGEDTHVGRGVRGMVAPYRLVLTATPIKNRLTDIFRLAWWAAGGKAEAHARFPYRDDPAERNKFAETFMVSERNLTREAKAKEKNAQGRLNHKQILKMLKSDLSDGSRERKDTGGRYKKLTAEVCNVHRLWKFLAPIVLRRRKQDAGEDIVPKVRRVVRCEMGTRQQQVYEYHLKCSYLDINGDEAIGARLQALRMAAAAPDSATHLKAQPGGASTPCHCTRRPNEDGSGHPASTPADQIKKPDPNCNRCKGSGNVALLHVSGSDYIPKVATTLTLIEEILARKEQVVVFSAFNDPLDNIARYLSEAGVRHCLLDGRTSQKKRGQHAAVFKRGRVATVAPVAAVCDRRPLDPPTFPVMLAGVECMAEGHSFHLANNVILIAYSWAYDKFIQAINRVHRMNSEKPVNVYVVLCTGTIDAKLESLIQDKGDAAELVLDGRLIGERTEEVNLAELLNVALREFDATNKTLDEALIRQQWPALRSRLQLAMIGWDIQPETRTPQPETRIRTLTIDFAPEPETIIPIQMNIKPLKIPTHSIPESQLPPGRAASIARAAAKQIAVITTNQVTASFRERMRAKVRAIEAQATPDLG